MSNHKNSYLTHEAMIGIITVIHFRQTPKSIRRITTGICNEVYDVGLQDKNVIVRLNEVDKFLMGSHDHIPKFKALNIKVPDILFEDYSKSEIPLAYQIQTKIEGDDLGNIIESLTDRELKAIAKNLATIFEKVKSIPSSNQFGVIWGGGDNELSETWAERMKIWIDESRERGMSTGVMDKDMSALANNLFSTYRIYFDSVKPQTYLGDVCSKNVMIHKGEFNGLVDLDGITQGDVLEAIGRIKLSWYGTHHGNVYANAIMDNLGLSGKERKLVVMYALLNQFSRTCENGIRFNQNTSDIINREKEKSDKEMIQTIVAELYHQ